VCVCARAFLQLQFAGKDRLPLLHERHHSLLHVTGLEESRIEECHLFQTVTGIVFIGVVHHDLGAVQCARTVASALLCETERLLSELFTGGVHLESTHGFSLADANKHRNQ
jgi:hypothetical protein